jgi:hypothetical protein
MARERAVHSVEESKTNIGQACPWLPRSLSLGRSFLQVAAT